MLSIRPDAENPMRASSNANSGLLQKFQVSAHDSTGFGACRSKKVSVLNPIKVM
jgi:hypothetical protein